MADLAAERLTRIAELSTLVREAVKDKSYQQCAIGRVVAEYLRWKEHEDGAAEATIRDYEIPLAYLCLDHPTLELADLEPPTGRKLVREFLDRHWGTGAPAYARARAKAGQRAPRTKAKNLSILSDFFTYCVGEDLMVGSPTIGIRRPKRRDSDRRVYAVGEPQQILKTAPTDREQCAVAILNEFGLRKAELAAVQLRDYDARRHILNVRGKGGKRRTLPVVTIGLRLLLDSHWAARLSEGSRDEYLLYPQKRGRRSIKDGGYEVAVIWEDRLRPLSPHAMHDWWKRMLALADIPATRKMHEMRHTAATDLLRSSGNLELTKQMLGHSDIKTTSMYAHLDMDDLAEALKLLAEKRVAEAEEHESHE
jgi:site-specific recombinase XerD